MPDSIYQADIGSAKEILYNWIAKSTSEKTVEWIRQKQTLFRQEENLSRNFFLAFGMVPRFTGKELLKLDSNDLEIARYLRNGLTPSGWTADQAARILLVLSLPYENKEQLMAILDQLFATADVGEQTALYLGLPLLPYPDAFKSRASEGIRTNMTVVFNAIALDNPYPAAYMEEAAWNQMVLKAIFVGSPLHRIQGLDTRANAALASTLSDFAHERWAARRPVPVELWRPVGPFINGQIIQDMEKLFASDDPAQQTAAALACAQSNFPGAKDLLSKHPDLAGKIESGQLTWDSFSKQLPAQ
jgi:hypothetical protein